jgi:hypothetical protein
MSGAGVNFVVLLAAVAVIVGGLGLVVATRRRARGPNVPSRPLDILPRSASGRMSIGLAVAYVVALQGLLGFGWADPLDNRSAGDWISKALLFVLVAASVVLGANSRRSERSVVVLVGMIAVTWLGLVPLVGSLFFE